ncbi:MAG: NUDIX hydrolase [Oscillospiraceae bacterium]
MDKQPILQGSVHPLGSLSSYIYVAMVSRQNGCWLLSRHLQRQTWETQGGHIERGETPLRAAHRELYEECGAKEYTMVPLCDYAAAGTTGVCFFAEVKSCLPLPVGSEMTETKLFKHLPQNLTYPGITPVLFACAEEFILKNAL